MPGSFMHHKETGLAFQIYPHPMLGADDELRPYHFLASVAQQTHSRQSVADDTIEKLAGEAIGLALCARVSRSITPCRGWFSGDHMPGQPKRKVELLWQATFTRTRAAGPREDQCSLSNRVSMALTFCAMVSL